MVHALEEQEHTLDEDILQHGGHEHALEIPEYLQMRWGGGGGGREGEGRKDRVFVVVNIIIIQQRHCKKYKFM